MIAPEVLHLLAADTDGSGLKLKQGGTRPWEWRKNLRGLIQRIENTGSSARTKTDEASKTAQTTITREYPPCIC
jgi:hypothetical protein